VHHHASPVRRCVSPELLPLEVAQRFGGALDDPQRHWWKVSDTRVDDISYEWNNNNNELSIRIFSPSWTSWTDIASTLEERGGSEEVERRRVVEGGGVGEGGEWRGWVGRTAFGVRGPWSVVCGSVCCPWSVVCGSVCGPW
jgi:hypothetical protein